MPDEFTMPAHDHGTPRVAIVDMDRRVQTALADLLRVHGLDVVGSAGDAHSAISLVKLGADVLIVDPRLPDLASGRALVSNLSREWPQVRVVIMGWGDSGDSPVSREVSGFISKSASPEQFVAAALAACGC